MRLWLAGPIWRCSWEYSWSHRMIRIYLFALQGWMKHLLIASNWLDFQPEEPHRGRVSSSQILAITSLRRIPFISFYPFLSILGQPLWPARALFPFQPPALIQVWLTAFIRTRLDDWDLKIHHLLVRLYQTFHLQTVKWLNFCNSVCPKLLIQLAPDGQRLQSFGLKNSCYYHYQLCDFVITLWNWRLWNPGAQRACNNILADKSIKRTQLKDKTNTISLAIYLLRWSSVTCLLLVEFEAVCFRNAGWLQI